MDQVLKNILNISTVKKQNIFMPSKVAVFQAMSDSTLKSHKLTPVSKRSQQSLQTSTNRAFLYT